MSTTLTIGGRTVGPGHPAFVIAEAGVNHNGSVDLALKLVDAARESKVDCIKFQTYKAERVATADAPKASYQLEVTDPKESQIAMLKALELDHGAYPGLMAACAKAGLVFMSTPYNEEDIDFLVNLGVPALKLASIHAAEPSLLRAAAAPGVPVILSTGMCTMAEVKRAVEVFHGAGNRKLILLQCTTNYPSAVADANLRAMVAMGEQLGVMMGYSDHTQSDTACIAAIALGAHVIEKHFTLDKTMPGPDQPTSLEPPEMTRLMTAIREAEAALGTGVKTPPASEARNIPGMRRGIVARRAIKQGARIAAEDLILKRPLSEITPAQWDEVVGSTAARDIAEGAALKLADLT
ncbi:MAG: N-acetylneuraminate synthase family protein [Rhodospirillaceae bacterium]|nr:N-acetylneuraminate synthase family protein [Rhodospirillaceae bacterium]